MGSFRTIIFIAALLHGSAASASEDPCALADDVDVARMLGGPIVPVPVEEIGEETAPYCLWATAGRKAEIKLEIWSEAELPVLNMPDAETYFVTLEAELREHGRLVPLDGFGARAFEAGFAEPDTRSANGTIVILKTGRVTVLDFSHVAARDARAFAARLAVRL